jgi:hypothetical protein
MPKFSSLENWQAPELPKVEAELIDVPDSGTESDFFRDFSDSWTASRELDSTVGAINRQSQENEFPVDPSYNLDNLEELTKDTPVEMRALLQTRLMDSKSALHAEFIRDRFNHELEKDEEIAGFGAAGLGARIGVNIFDETAIILGLASGPAAASYKLSRLQRAIRLAGIAGVENAAIESIIAAGSQTRTVEDVAYAGLFGMVLGGAIGAVVKGPAPRKGSNVDESTKGLSERARVQMDSVDDSMVADLKGETRPIPEPVARMNESTQTELDEITTPAPRPAAEPEVPVAREPAVTPKVAEQAAARTARRAEIDARLDELAKADVEVPKTPESISMLPGVRAKVEELQTARAAAKPGDKVAKQKLTRLEVEVNKLKQKFIRTIKKDDPDAFLASNLTTNPPLDTFAAFLGKGVDATLKKVRTTSEKAEAASDKAFKDIDDEVAALTKEVEEMEADEALSVGAAEAGTGAKPLDTMTDEEAEFFANTPDTAFKNIRFGLYAQLNRSENPIMKKLGHILMRDSVGSADHSVTNRSAAEIAEMHHELAQVHYHKGADAGFEEWLIETNKRHGKWDPAIREEYNAEVTRAIETGTEIQSPGLKKGIKATRDVIRRTMEAAEHGGVRGFEGRQHSDDYMPHIINSDAWTEAARKYSWDKTRSGMKSPLDELVYRSLKSAHGIEGEDEVLRRLAQGYVRNVRGRAAGIEGRYNDIAMTSDPDQLRALLRDVEIDEDAIDYVVNLTRMGQEAGEKGRTARAKHRTLLDMEQRLEVRDKETGETVQLKMRDLYEQDSQKLVTSYVRSVGGLASIAERTKGTAFHIRGEDDFARALHLAARYEADVTRNTGMAAKFGELFGRASTGGGDKLTSEIEGAKMAWNAIVGRPMNDPTDMWTKTTRRLTDLNFARMMGQVMWAQVAEFGPVVSSMGLNGLRRGIPEIHGMIRRAETGEVDNELTRVAEEWLGTGTEWMRGKYNYVMYKDPDAYGQGIKMYDTAMHFANRAVGFPLMKMMEFQQRLYATSMLHNFGDAAMGRKKFTKGQLNRLAAHNMDGDALERVKAQYKEHGTFEGDGKGKLTNPNFDNWDPDVRDEFLGTLFAMGRRAVQQNDIGNLNPLMNKNVGKILFQFRTFVAGAWEKHLLHNVHQRDMEAFMGFALSTTMAAAAYTGQTVTKTLGMDEGQRKKFLKKNLSHAKIAQAGFDRSTHASLLPSLRDTGMALFGQTDGWTARASGQSQNLITGNPTYDLLVNRVHGAVKGVINTPRTDYNFSQQDMKNIRYSLPFANLLGMGNLWNIAESELPKKSQSKR